MNNSTGIIILAAGRSLRLGRPKQLLSYNHSFLIQHIIGEALIAKLHPVIVVTGANAGLIAQAINHGQIKLVYNPHWLDGMASGISAGIMEVLLNNTDLKQVIIAVCDQPFVSAQLFNQLIAKKAETGKGIVASTYMDINGTPVLFADQYYPSLLQLRGEEGAKKLLKLYHQDVDSVSFPQGNVDIDTEDDYKKLLNYGM